MKNDGTAQLPPRMSVHAAEYDWLYYFVYWASLLLFVGVIGVMLYFVFRYHKSRNPKPTPTRPNTALELFWTFSPLILLVVLFHWGFQSYVKGSVAPSEAIEVRVRAKQWLWEFEYPNGYREIGVLRVPVKKPVRLIMSSDDVLHSFYIPVFRQKKDVIPGSYSTLWFEADRKGEAQVYCAEYCGTSHSGMLAKINVVSEAEYEKFLAEGAGPPEGASPAEWGEQLYAQNNCNTCHSLDGSKLVGPSWKGLFGRSEAFEDGSSVIADENYIKESILEPNAKVVKGYSPVMPAYVMQDAQIDALIAYIKTLD